MLFHKGTVLSLIILLAAIPLFWRIGTRGINEWDEARNGVNAHEMRQTGDLINLYYGGRPDTWNAKPPLLIWMIAAGYGIFGEHCLSLRLPSALATIGFFIVLYLLIARSKNRLSAIVACSLLLSCKAAIGGHLGLTGDFDALLIFFLVASAFCFHIYVHDGKPAAIFWSALFTGLAWYTKGPAALVYFPGFLLYAFIQSGTGIRFKWQQLIAAAMLLAAIITSWIWLSAQFGKTAGAGHYGSGSSIRTMLVEDTWHRLTSSRFEGGQPADYLFFFEVLDVRLNLWNYLFYFSIATGLFLFFRKPARFLQRLREEDNGLLSLALCILIPPALLLSFAAYKYDWYLGPVFWTTAFIAAKGILYLQKLWKGTLPAIVLLMLFGYARQLYQINDDARQAVFIPGSLAQGTDTIMIDGALHQDVMLQLEWMNKPVVQMTKGLKPHGGLLIAADTLSPDVRVLASAPAHFAVGSSFFGKW